MTYNVSITLSEEQDEFLKRHVSSLETREPGNDPGTILIRRTYPGGIPTFFQDMFYASVSHLIPMPTSGEHAELQRLAEVAAKRARDAKIQAVNVTVATPAAAGSSASTAPAAEETPIPDQAVEVA